MARSRGARVHGPYKHRNRWRVVGVDGEGRQVRESFETEREARAFIAEARAQLEAITVRHAVDAYLEHQRARGLRSTTITRERYALGAILDMEHRGDDLVRSITPKVGAALYAALQTRSAVDTHRNTLSVAKAWGRWVASKGWLPGDPFAAVKPIGRRKRGKPQPRVDEARALIATTLAAARSGDVGAAAVLVAMLLGTRATEATSREVRDLDDGGRLLWIPDSKTEAGRRTLAVPDVIRPILLRLADGRAPDAPLFRKHDGDRATRYWLYHHVHRMCAAAGVALVSPHGLRGLQGTLATLAGQTPHAVAAVLGHASPEITKAAYIDPLAIAAERQRIALAALGLGEQIPAPEFPAPSNGADDDLNSLN